MISDDLRWFWGFFKLMDSWMQNSFFWWPHLLRKTRRRIEEMRQETCPDREEKISWQQADLMGWRHQAFDPKSKFIRLVDEYRLPCFLDVWRELAFETGTTVAHRWKSVEIAPIEYCIQYRYWSQSINQIQFRTQEKEDEEEKETKDGTEDKETADASCLSEVEVVNLCERTGYRPPWVLEQRWECIVLVCRSMTGDEERDETPEDLLAFFRKHDQSISELETDFSAHLFRKDRATSNRRLLLKLNGEVQLLLDWTWFNHLKSKVIAQRSDGPWVNSNLQLQVLDLQKEMRGLILTNPSLMPEVDIKQPVSYIAVVQFIFDHRNPSRDFLSTWGKSASSAWFMICLKRSFDLFWLKQRVIKKKWTDIWIHSAVHDAPTWTVNLPDRYGFIWHDMVGRKECVRPTFELHWTPDNLKSLWLSGLNGPSTCWGCTANVAQPTGMKLWRIHLTCCELQHLVQKDATVEPGMLDPCQV